MDTIAYLRDEYNRKIQVEKEFKGFPALMGDTDGVIDAGNGNVYVTPMNGQVIAIPNRHIGFGEKPILIGTTREDPSTLQVLGEWDIYDTPWPPNTVPHAPQHDYGNFDVDWITLERVKWMLVLPLISTGNFYVQIFGGVLKRNGVVFTVPNSTLNLEESIPATGALYALIQSDSNGVVTAKINAGLAVTTKELLTNLKIPAVDIDSFAMCAIALYDSQPKLQRDIRPGKVNDFIDLRFSLVFGQGADIQLDTTDFDGFLDTGDTTVQDAIDNYDDHVHSSAELLGILDPYYPRKWLKSAAPTVDDDITEGYGKSDIWIDQASGDAYICINNADGVADWLKVASGPGGAMGFAVDGRLAVTDNATSPIVITADTTISSWIFYLGDLGTSGSTVLDVVLQRVGDADVSIFAGGTMPEIAYDDYDNLIECTPTTTDFIASDVLILNIEQIAPISSDAVLVAGVSGSGGGGGLDLTVTDGVTSVSNVGKITLEGALTISNDGGGEITVTIPVPRLALLDNPTIPDLTDFAWVNQGSATASQFNYGVNLIAPALAGDNLRGLEVAAPADPYIVDAGFYVNNLAVNYSMSGIFIRDSATGKLITFQLGVGVVNKISITNSAGPTGSGSSPLEQLVAIAAQPFFMRINDTGVNHVFSCSTDGVHWAALYSASRTAWLAAPDKIGFFAASINATYMADISLCHWLITE